MLIAQGFDDSEISPLSGSRLRAIAGSTRAYLELQRFVFLCSPLVAPCTLGAPLPRVRHHGGALVTKMMNNLPVASVPVATASPLETSGMAVGVRFRVRVRRSVRSCVRKCLHLGRYHLCTPLSPRFGVAVCCMRFAT